MMGFIRGVRLEDRLIQPGKTPLAPAARGSAGIPDSLARKPVDTSGRAAWSPFPPSTLGRPVIPPHVRRHPPSLFVSSNLFHSLMRTRVAGLAIPVRGDRCDQPPPNCGNSWNYDRTDGFLLRAKRVMKMAGHFYCMRHA